MSVPKFGIIPTQAVGVFSGQLPRAPQYTYCHKLLCAHSCPRRWHGLWMLWPLPCTSLGCCLLWPGEWWCLSATHPLQSQTVTELESPVIQAKNLETDATKGDHMEAGWIRITKFYPKLRTNHGREKLPLLTEFSRSIWLASIGSTMMG